MNRKNLTAAVLAGLAGAAGIAGSAQAVNLNPDGLGQVLLYPYYTTNGGNTTLLSVVNTTSDAKAVKVRFLEGKNSREVLDFNLYLSAYDVWTAALYDDAGTPTMVTNDATCTVPYIYGNGGVQEFLPWALDDAAYNDVDAEGEIIGEYDDISRAAEGHFEMIEMGTLLDSEIENDDWVDLENFEFCVVGSDEEYGNPSDDCKDKGPVDAEIIWSDEALAELPTLTPYGSASAATHDDGVPADCDQLVAAWTKGATSKTDGYWIMDAMNDISDPSGGLFGGAAIVNVSAGTMYSYDAKAIDGFWAVDPPEHAEDGSDVSHQEPGTILPSLDSGGNVFASVFVQGNVIESGHLNRGVDAVSYVLMHDQIMNEYTTEAAVGGGTEWVVTFPTKQFYVHAAFLNYYDDEFRDDYYDEFEEDEPIDPFTSNWYWVETTYDSDDEVDEEGYLVEACEEVSLDTIWDREERTIVDPEDPPGTPVPPIVSPAPPPGSTPPPDEVIPFELCYETSVIAFGDHDPDDPTPILGSHNSHAIDNTALGFEYGWARLNLYTDGDPEEPSAIRDPLGNLAGLPVTGFAVQSFVNSFLGEGADVLANYGGIFQHKATRRTVCGSQCD